MTYFQPPERVPPHNYEAEQALLGAILMNNRALERVVEYLRPEHFAEPAHGRIYAAAIRLTEQGKIANPVTLAGYFTGDDQLADIGGPRYLAQLAAAAVTIINAGDYGRMIHDLHLRRELIALGEDLVNDAYQPTMERTAMDHVTAAEARLFDLASTGQAERGPSEFPPVASRAMDRIEAVYKADGRLVGTSTGLRELDARTGGLQAPDLMILAGRPSMGKTALATNIALSVATNHHRDKALGGPVLFFSQEMSDTQLADRILAEAAGVAVHRVRNGPISAAEFTRLADAAADIGGVPLHIDDSAALTVSTVRLRARRMKRRYGLGLIVVDYLQLMRGETGDNRVQEISAITRGLKATAKDLNVPIIVLSQLSRAVEQREDKRPQLADLRESGAIEQDADIVGFVFREQYYLERAEPMRRGDESGDKFGDRYDRWRARLMEVANTAEIIIAKNRQGPVGTVRLSFDAAFTRFGDLDTNEGRENHD